MKKGDVVADKYVLKKHLGSGGMGKVYLAIHRFLKKDFAIKFLNPFLLDNDEIRLKFIEEARIGADLKHPNIAEVFDIDIREEDCFLVMEYIEGEDLSYLMERRRFKEEVIIHIAIQILDALNYAHSRGIVHRDIKPSNIMLTRSGKAYLTDFGIAKALDSAGLSQKKSQTILTPEFAAPEQASKQRFGKISTRTDIYAFGVMLYYLAAGKLPFSGDTGEVLVKHMTEEPPDLHTINPHLSKRFCAIVEKAIRKKQADRFQSAREMKQALKGIREGLVVEERPGEEEIEETAVIKVREDVRVPPKEKPAVVRVKGKPKPKPKPRVRAEPPPRAKRPSLRRWAGVTFGGLVVIGIITVIYILAGRGEKMGIPDVVGMGEESALALLEESGLAYTVEEQEASLEEAGIVLNQTPIAGKYSEEEFPKGSEVILMVGVEAVKLVMPDLVGMERDEAKSELERMNLSYKVSLKETSAGYVGKVISQSPVSGSEITTEEVVYLTIGEEESKKHIPPDGVPCPYCGFMNRTGAEVCGGCGEELQKK